MSKIIILIPARIESSRFPGKPLAKINGKEMLIRVIEKCSYEHEVYAVVNDPKIVDLVSFHGYKHILINEECKTGTDRICLALKHLNISGEDIIINVQGDEPMIEPWMIEKVINTKIENKDCVVNAFAKIKTKEEFNSKATIKIVRDKNNKLLYASRGVIPSNKKIEKLYSAYKQVCIYAFNLNHLKLFKSSSIGEIEIEEDIEILRFIENDISPVIMCYLGEIDLIAVDYPDKYYL